MNYLHQNGVLYRDLKPENILVNGDGCLKLTDFGLSKLNISGSLNDDSDRIIGTLEYAAPEVLEGKGHSIASEWWALGCLIYELLVGVPPFLMNDNVSSSVNSRQKMYNLINA